MQHEYRMEGLLMRLEILNSIFSSRALNASFPCLTSIMTPAVTKKGLKELELGSPSSSPSQQNLSGYTFFLL